ncbi:porin [Hahella ganghwensis]|uniref:porin n=1 Tax=Hahella ganghwensis TaxID=286420 RepID=UPI00036EF18A|nr:porin [Hahella ganghwensis]
MKKTLIASAVAAASMASVAQAAEMMPEFYGNIQLAYIHTSEETGSTETTTNDFADNGSTLGFKHSHEISPGLTGFLKAELEFDADENHGDGINKVDEAFIGVKGDFGSVQVGTDDTVYEWWDVIDISEAVGISGEFEGVYEGDNLQYVSPTIAGGLTVGVTLALDSTERHTGAIGAKYKTDMFEVILGYSLGREETIDHDDNDATAKVAVDTGDSIGLGANIFLGDLTLGVQYETKSADSVSGTDDPSTEADGYGFIAIYSLGASQLAAGYYAAENDADPSAEEDKFYLQALHNVSDNMYAYVEYTNGSEEAGASETDIEEFAIGATYYF